MKKISAHEESEKVEVQFKNLGTVNKNTIRITKGTKEIILYFSYETLIAVNQYVSVNDWSTTTEKFLNELQPNKTLRVPHSEVLQKVQELLNEVLK